MKSLLKFGSLALATGLVFVAALTACTSMQVAEKNIEEGRLVPEAAFDNPDILSEYHHFLAPPRGALAGLDIALERNNVLDRGGKLLVQVGLSTAPPVLKAIKVHALVFASSDADKNERTRIAEAINAIRGAARALPGSGSMTIDWIEPIDGLGVAAPSLLSASSGGNLKDFLTRLARRPFGVGEHHVVLLAGSSKGFLSGLSARERQDVVDIGRILAAKSVTLSVLSVGTKPDFAFLQKLAETGHGTFNVATDSLDYDAWIREDLRTRSAESLSDIELVVKTKNQTRLDRVLAPGGLPHSDNSATYAPAGIKEGEQRVLLMELEIPAEGRYPRSEVLDIHLKYRAPGTGRYYTVHKTVAVQYVDDPNLALPHPSKTIQRSLLILKTQETLQSVVRDIRSRRNYLAIASLTAQSRALTETGKALKDPELLRDATVLAKYADRLYDFDGDWFKGIKIWHDLNWDTSRFSGEYR